MNDRYEKAKIITEANGASKLLTYYGELSESDREKLLDDILAVDFDKMRALYALTKENAAKDKDEAYEDIRPMPCFDTTAMSQADKEREYAIGLEQISCGKLAVLTMAGGQGTRLGHNGPKGTYDIGLESHKSLFEIQHDSLKSICDKANVYIHWYIMTSHINNDDTVAFFEKKNYFGYPKEYVHFFPQTMIPALSKDGSLLLETKCSILKSPNGNGGLFVSALNEGAIADMKKHGIEALFICGIDNCLVRMCDPLFMGLFTSSKQQAAAKSFMKRAYDEKAGILCYQGDRPSVIEYTEIPYKYASMKDEKGQWVFPDANVLNYIFRLDVFEKLAGEGMPYHVAVKKLAFIDTETGETNTIPDGYKFELFLFDSFMHLDSIKAVRININEEFAPVKNKTGIDSAESAREMYINNHGQHA